MEKKINPENIILGIVIICTVLILFSSDTTFFNRLKDIIIDNLILVMIGALISVYALKYYKVI